MLLDTDRQIARYSRSAQSVRSSGNRRSYRTENQMASDRQRQLQTWIDRRESRLDFSLREAQKAVRHKCFVSFHHDDDAEVVDFIDAFEDVFIPRVLGITDDDSDLIDSTDVGYVMDEIRERYLTDSSVTIVLVGKCTWARRYVDWEVYSTLRNDKKNRRSGLLPITLPSAARLPGSSWNFDGDPTVIVMVRR